jgi:signal transduction histidine kinase
LGLVFPAAALVAAVLVLATAPLSVGLALLLLATLVPWALVAGEVRVGPWPMVVVGVGLPGVIVGVYEAHGVIFLALLAVGWLAATGESVWAETAGAIGAVVVIPVLIPFMEDGGSGDHEAFIYFATGGLTTWFFGRVLRRERELVAALRDAQDRLHAAAAAAERQRIAHDVHDVVGHSLTVMLLNVAGARRVLPGDPETAAEALDRAEQAGRESLDSVRAVVGLLRSPDDAGEAEPPQPGVADIEGLVRTAATAGLPVRFESQGDLATVDPYAGLAAFRLVQEAISNVEHHAPGADAVVSVRVTGDGDGLAVSVRNGPGSGSVGAGSVGTSGGGGTGLDAMRQRLAALGGTLFAGPNGDGWAVEGTIPLRRTGPASGAGR